MLILRNFYSKVSSKLNKALFPSIDIICVAGKLVYF